MSAANDGLKAAFERRVAEIRIMLEWLECEIERLEGEMAERPDEAVLLKAGRIRGRVKALLAAVSPASEGEIEEALAELGA